MDNIIKKKRHVIGFEVNEEIYQNLRKAARKDSQTITGFIKKRVNLSEFYPEEKEVENS